MKRVLSTICVYAHAGLSLFFTFYFCLIPFGIVIYNLQDPGLKNDEMPRFAYRWHRNLSEQLEPWAKERVALKKAENLSLNDISGTEWPIFSAVYYLWATEALQEAWEKDPSLSVEMPAVYAQDALEAAAALVADPNHAAWVKKHWGDDYLHQENLFYRMLLISGLTSYQNLLNDSKYETLLVNQVESLAQELDASPHGLLDDYPGQCYPIDILPAIAVIQRSGELLGQDYSSFVERSVRGFSGSRLDPDTQLPAYIANSRTGEGIGPARGVGVSYMLIWAPEVWPEVAADWYEKYEHHFWQENLLVSGVREFSAESSKASWSFEIDAGPIMAGYGTAASAFGIGAARANGRYDQAYPLSAEALVTFWPLADGTLLLTRPLSNFEEAPFIGETALLFNFTRLSSVDTPPELALQARLPFFVYLGLSLYLIMGSFFLLKTRRRVNNWQIVLTENPQFSFSPLQIALWLTLVIAGLLFVFNRPLLTLMIALSMQVFLREKWHN